MPTLVSSGTVKVSIRPNGRTVIIGERCNALGYRNVAKAAANGKWSVLVNRAKEQLAAGAQIINVNMVGVKTDAGVAVPEVELLPDACRAILSKVDAPLSIDFGSAEALEAAVKAIREVKGPDARPLINSNSAESGKRDAVFAIAAEYKLPLILLPCDDRGIPNTPEARIDVATQLIVHGERQYGIKPEDCIIDGIAIGVATDIESKPGLVTMETMRRIKSELGCSCMLGASNASFGLPQRKLFDTYYLAVAVTCGMNVALMDPTHEPSRWAILSADVLTGADVGCRNYLQAHRAMEKAQLAAQAAAGDGAALATAVAAQGEKSVNPIPRIPWTPVDHFYLRVGSWFDGEQFHAAPALLEIEHGRISEIHADSGEAALPLLDAGALSVAPTLVDSHVHCYLSAWPIDPDHRGTPGEKPFENEVADGLNRVAEMQGSGIGAARDMGDPKLYNNAIRARLAAAGSPFTFQSGGQGLFMPGRYGRFLGVAADPADLVKEVDRLATVEKVDFIKLIPTGIINFAKGTVSAPPSYAVEHLVAVVNRAHELGLKVAAHCSGEAGLDRCIAAKVDFIEHAYFGTRTQLEQMRDAGLHWTPTFIPVQVQWKHATVCGWDAKTVANLARILDEHTERLRIAREIGLSVLSGSDAGGAGVGHGGGLIEEIERLATVFTAAEAHSIATRRTHTALGITDEGRIAVGARAKLVFYTQPPAENIARLREPRFILQGSSLCPALSPRTSDLPTALQFGLDPVAAAAPAASTATPAAAAAAPSAP